MWPRFDMDSVAASLSQPTARYRAEFSVSSRLLYGQALHGSATTTDGRGESFDNASTRTKSGTGYYRKSSNDTSESQR